MFENLTREEKLDFLQSPVWSRIRECLFDKKVGFYQVITNENTKVPEVKSKADKLSIIDEIFELEKELIQSLNIKGEIQ